ncbi:MAG: hypothetical protein WCJ26_13280 [bacterium]
MTLMKINQDDANEEIAGAFSKVIQQRAEGLEQLRSLQDVKDKLLIREQERLTQKYGSAHPRVQKISNRISHNKEFVKALDIELDRTKIKVAEVDSTSWMVHGRVLNEQYRGIPNLTIALYDEKGKWMRALNFSCTSLQGYFSIIYPAVGKESEIPADQKLFIVVSDKEKKIIHRATEPLYIKTGTVDYREIIISAKNGTCEPPESEPQPEHETGPGPAPEEPKLPPDAWVARGKVTDEQNNGLKGLTISLYDKDLLFDDVLGTTTTNENGNFEIIYRTEAFKGLFDKKPDIYLKVLDNRGTVLYTSKKKVRPEAGRDEFFSVMI